MPCYSTITQTQIINAGTLMTALKKLNIDVYASTATHVSTMVGEFSRQSKSDSFKFRGIKKNLAPVGRKYAEITVREWGIRNGMSITENDGTKIKLQRRR